MKAARNLIGSQVRRLRYQEGLNQEELAAKCGIIGWDISRGTLAKIEAEVRCITDKELWVLAKALRVKLEELYPREPLGKRR